MLPGFGDVADADGFLLFFLEEEDGFGFDLPLPLPEAAGEDTV